MKSTISLLVFALAVLSTGCGVNVQPLKAERITLSNATVAPQGRSEASFVVHPFTEARPTEHSKLYASSLIPVVNLFHIGAFTNYPIESGSLQTTRNGQRAVLIGNLADDFPWLLTKAMQDTQLATEVVPAATAYAETPTRRFDYEIHGTVRRTWLEQHYNFVPLAFLGIVGVPYVFSNVATEVEISLYKSGDRESPLSQKTYRFERLIVTGLFYNLNPSYQSYAESMESILPKVIEDLASALQNTPRSGKRSASIKPVSAPEPAAADESADADEEAPAPSKASPAGKSKKNSAVKPR